MGVSVAVEVVGSVIVGMSVLEGGTSNLRRFTMGDALFEFSCKSLGAEIESGPKAAPIP